MAQIERIIKSGNVEPLEGGNNLVPLLKAVQVLTQPQAPPSSSTLDQIEAASMGNGKYQVVSVPAADSFKKNPAEKPAESNPSIDIGVDDIVSFDGNSLGTSGKTPEEIVSNRAFYSLYKSSLSSIDSLFQPYPPTRIDRFKGTDSSKKQQTLEIATTQVVGKDNKEYILYQFRNDNTNLNEGQKSIKTYIRGKNTPVFGVITGDSITFTVFAQKIDTEPGWNPFTGNPMGLGKVDSKYVPFYTVTYKLSGNNADFNFYNNNKITPTIVTVSNPVTDERAVISRTDLTKKMVSGGGALFSPIAVPPASIPTETRRPPTSTSTPRPPDTPRPPSTSIPPSKTPEPTPTQVANMTEEKFIKFISGGIIIGHYDGKKYNTENVLNSKDFFFWTFKNNSAEINNLQPGTEIMIINPSGEIIVWANPDEAKKRAKEGALLVIPNPNVRQGGLGNAVKVVLNSSFRAWEKDPTTPIHVQFGQYDANKMGPIMIFIDEIPMTDDNNCPILEKPEFFSVAGESDNYRSDKAGVTDPINWLKEMILKGYLGFSVYPNQESYDRAFPPGQ